MKDAQYLDGDGYPTEACLAHIRKWEGHDWRDLLEFICSVWHWGESMYKWRGKTLPISTGGWSGNEEVIDALQQNTMFWACCWQESKRGGGYKFAPIRVVQGKKP